MCKRTTTDPLVRRFLDKYGLHLLAVPRRSASVGDVYAADAAGAHAIGTLPQLLDGDVTVPVAVGEPMADITGMSSRAVSMQAGLQLLEAFLSAAGAAGLIDSVKARFTHEGDAVMSFAFEEPTRDHVDALALGELLDGRRIRETQPFDTSDYRFYVASAVARSQSIKVAAHRKSGDSIDLSAGLAHVAEAGSKVHVAATEAGTVVYRGTDSLAFGIELFELSPDTATGRIGLRIPNKPVGVRGRAPRPARALIGDPLGDVFVDISG